MYQEELMDHYHHPRNNGSLEEPDFTAMDFNPSCGDRVCFQGRIKNEKLVMVMFTGSGCILSQATASMLTEKCLGKTVHELLEISKDEIVAMIGISLGPNRIKCVLLPLFVLQEGVRNHMKGNYDRC